MGGGGHRQIEGIEVEKMEKIPSLWGGGVGGGELTSFPKLKPCIIKVFLLIFLKKIEVISRFFWSH